MSEAISTAISQPIADTLTAFKQGVDNLLAKRSYFISQVLPKFKENQDYYEIKGRKSLAKGGAEKLASIYNLTATFERDDASMTAFSSIKDMIAYICNLYRGDRVVGQGRGAAVLSKNQGDVNRSLKMAQKSAFIDAVIRSTGLSDIFTQDIEDSVKTNILSRRENMGHNDPIEIETALKTASYPSEKRSSSHSAEETIDNYSFIPATDKQKSYLNRLVSQRYSEPEELEQSFKQIESASKSEASQMIEELLNI